MLKPRRGKRLGWYVGLSMLTMMVAIAPGSSARSYNHQTGSQMLSASADRLLEAGRREASSGRYSQAARLWQQAVVAYGQQGEALGSAQSWSYLSFAYLQLGQLQQAQAAIAESKSQLQQASDQPGTAIILASTLNTQGSILLARGETTAALEIWESAAKTYELAGDELGKLGAIINQAQAMQTMGLYRRARKTLQEVNQQLQSQPDSLMKATGLRSLGVALQVVGDLDESTAVLQQSLAIAQQLESQPSISATLFSLAKTARAKQDTERAIAYYQQAAASAANPLEKTEALLGQLQAYQSQKQWELARTLLPEIQVQMKNLPSTRMSVYARVNLAASMMQMPTTDQTSAVEIAEILAAAAGEAQQLQDQRGESYALGQMGKLYQKNGQLTAAKNLTEQALQIAVEMELSEIASRWQAQLGEILEARGDTQGAIAAYTSAVNSFESLRSDLLAISEEVQFSFRDSIEPVYRGLVSLLLRDDPTQADLIQARQVIESLQLAELDNFFRDACLDVQAEQIDQVDTTAAVIYPIILSDRVEVILSVPGKPLKNYKTFLPQAEVESTLRQARGALSLSFPKRKRLEIYQQIYDWLIRPAEQSLSASEIETLVFVLDGYMRNLPMAALYDGQQYLVENYSVALTPGLQLLSPRPLRERQLTTLVGGLSESRQGFMPLPGVETEVQRVATKISSEVLLNQEFTHSSLEATLLSDNSPVLHLATHGQFSSNAADTFILAWDDKIDVVELANLLSDRERNPERAIELLVLSACQTAKGDNRAVLGLAGLAVRSGARSTMATLWSVRDDSTADLMTEFYQQLASSDNSKSEALRQAQLSLLSKRQYNHPFYWAPFILVGNWL
ncbi:MAG: CHAT domain-containing protein [Hormoscilla sp.]